MTKQSTFSERMFNAGVRVEQMIWLPGLAGVWTDGFQDFIRNDLADEPEVLSAIPFLREHLEGEPDMETIVGELARGRFEGFLAQLAHPVPTSFHSFGGYSFSWGYYQTRWFYFETLEKLCARAETWGKEVVEAEREASARKASKKSARS